MVGIVVKDDVVSIPVPIVTVGNIEGSDAKVVAGTEPEAVRTASGNSPAVVATHASGEAAVFPRTIEVKAAIVWPVIVANPLAVMMDVRSLWMTLLIAVSRTRFARPTLAAASISGWRLTHGPMGGRSAMWNETATHGFSTTALSVAAVLSIVLRESGEREYERKNDNYGKWEHVQPPQVTAIRGTAVT